MTETRQIEQDDILSMISCAESYGHSNSICIGALVDWASPITDQDIERFSIDLASGDGYGKEDYDEAKKSLIEARERFTPSTTPAIPTT